MEGRKDFCFQLSFLPISFSFFSCLHFFFLFLFCRRFSDLRSSLVSVADESVLLRKLLDVERAERRAADQEIATLLSKVTAAVGELQQQQQQQQQQNQKERKLRK